MPAHPYRPVPVVPAPRERAIDMTPVCALPLGVIALAFFLPVMQDCDSRIVSPLDEASKSVGSFFWIAPLFVASAVLCVTIVHAYVKRGGSFAALAFVGIHIASAATVACVAIADDGAKDAAWAIPAVPSLVLYALAWQRRGPRRLSLLVDAHVLAAIPLAGLVVMMASYWGGYVFVGAFVFLVVLRAVQLVGKLTAALSAALREALRARARERRPAR